MGGRDSKLAALCAGAAVAAAFVLGGCSAPDTIEVSDARDDRRSDAVQEAEMNERTLLEADVLDWRERRRARLTEPYGYLSLVGLVMLEPGTYRLGRAEDADIVLPGGPDRWGRLVVGADEVVFDVDPAAIGRVMVGGQAAASAVLAAGDEPTLIEAGGIRAHLVTPGDRRALRVRDPESPTRVGFRGLDYFPIDPAYRVVGEWLPHEAGRTVQVANVLGQLIDEPNPGRVEFELDGTRYSLEAIDSDDDLFYIVADRTSGRETYGLGRFLYSDWPDQDGRVVLDFNRLYNPPCAFSEFTTCPLPPQGNRLDVRLRAGELKYAGSSGRTAASPAD
ncbi:DUF1684 domain-containing protein [Halomonas denitrificans]|nr:DUF1684 domain-containing protein [Halomonas denitrificans]